MATIQEMQQILKNMKALGAEQDWSYGFIESLISQIEAGRDLSRNQIGYYDRAKSLYSDEVVANAAAFGGKYTASEEMQTIFKYALRYYERVGYYSRIVKTYKDNDERIPTERDYNKVVENKYFKGIWNNYKATPKYEVGTAVAFSSKADRYYTTHFPNGAIVMSNDIKFEEIKTHAKGGRMVKLLPIGGAEMITCEERELKRFPKNR